MDMKEKLAAAIRAAAEQGIADGVFPEAELAAVELEIPPTVPIRQVEELLAGTGFFELGRTTGGPSMVFGETVVMLSEAEEAYTEPL